MPIGKMPQNQLDAFPLIDFDVAANPGQVTIVGGTLFRYWSAAALSISATSVTTDGTSGKVFIATPYLDCRGCNNFAMLWRRSASDGLAKVALPACDLQYQYRLSSADAPPITFFDGAAINDNMGGISSVNTASMAWAALPAGAIQRCLRTWGASEIVGFAGSSVTIGSDVRIIMSFSTNPVAVENIFTAALWAQS